MLLTYPAPFSEPCQARTPAWRIVARFAVLLAFRLVVLFSLTAAGCCLCHA